MIRYIISHLTCASVRGCELRGGELQCTESVTRQTARSTRDPRKAKLARTIIATPEQIAAETTRERQEEDRCRPASVVHVWRVWMIGPRRVPRILSPSNSSNSCRTRRGCHGHTGRAIERVHAPPPPPIARRNSPRGFHRTQSAVRPRSRRSRRDPPRIATLRPTRTALDSHRPPSTGYVGPHEWLAPWAIARVRSSP